MMPLQTYRDERGRKLRFSFPRAARFAVVHYGYDGQHNYVYAETWHKSRLAAERTRADYERAFGRRYPDSGGVRHYGHSWTVAERVAE